MDRLLPGGCRGLQAAFDNFARLLELKQTLLGWQHPEVGQLLAKMADVSRQMGHDERALALYTRAMPIFQATLPQDHPEIGALLASMGIAQCARGQFAAAAQSLERAVAAQTAARCPHLAVG